MNEYKLDGFKQVSGVGIKRMIIRAAGFEGTGKSHFALTAPAPIAYFDCDRGTEGVVEKFADKILLMTHFRDLPSVTQDDHEAKWEEIKKRYYTAVESKFVRTITLDTDAELWEMIRIARFGRLEQIPAIKYATVNREFRGLFDAAYDSGKNVICITRMKKQYMRKENSKSDMGDWNGKWEAAGFSELQYIVQCNVETFRNGQEFGIRVLKARQNMQIMGDEFTGDMCSFPFLGIAMFPDSELEDWE